MTNRAFSLLLVLVGCSLLFATPAFATTMHGDYSGATIDFLGVQETTNTAGDPEPLYGAPTSVIGDTILFSPSNFVSSSMDGTVLEGGTGSDQTASLLEMTLSAHMGSVIEQVVISEAGDAVLTGFGGTPTTGAFVSLSGLWRVTEVNGVPFAGPSIGFTGTFDQDLFGLPADFGASTWVGSAIIDVAALYPGATRVELDIDNFLFTGSEPGTSSFIQKKATDGFGVTAVPEPTTLALMGLGLLAVVVAGRRER